MPPKRRKAAAAPASAASHGSALPASSDDESGSAGQERSARFFNTTFSTYRTSPFYTGATPIDTARLQTLSQRLRDTLVGDVVRGVQVGLEGDATLGRAGALELVEWRWVRMSNLLSAPKTQRTRDESEDLSSRDARPRALEARKALCLELQYENATFCALLLPDLESDDSTHAPSRNPSWTWPSNNQPMRDAPPDPGQFLSLPLLLLRMPNPLKSVLVDFLSSTFDCRISPLRIGTQTIVRSWETWLTEQGVINRRRLSKDVGLTLGFHVEPQRSSSPDKHEAVAAEVSDGPAPSGLKSIDIIIPAEEATRFVRRGEKLVELSRNSRKRSAGSDDTWQADRARRRWKLAGDRDEEGWIWRGPLGQDQDTPSGGTEAFFEQPFTEALGRYVNHHIALDMFHPRVRVLRVACDGFALSEGRVKVFTPPSNGSGRDDINTAVEALVQGLVRKAKGRDWGEGAVRLASLTTGAM
ncbi:kinetochore complex Sim4 subunit Fta1-domain-containing protein [Xylariaceae sp. FL0016]|nr:kinetochore complex Sim4 subunit Fta1-domain-containing protein [Xylariaceae sp. FL0016]